MRRVSLNACQSIKPLEYAFVTSSPEGKGQRKAVNCAASISSHKYASSTLNQRRPNGSCWQRNHRHCAQTSERLEPTASQRLAPGLGCTLLTSSSIENSSGKECWKEWMSTYLDQSGVRTTHVTRAKRPSHVRPSITNPVAESIPEVAHTKGALIS